MVELQNHSGVIKLSRRHEWQQGVVLDQPHLVHESGISHQRRDVVIGLSMEVSRVKSDVPQNRVPDE